MHSTVVGLSSVEVVLFALLLATLLIAPVTPEPTPPTRDDAAIWADAAALEQAGDCEAAAQVFSPLAEAYPQDYMTQLQAAWLAFCAQDYVTAEARYAAAIALSNGAPEARSGLAWTHLRQDHDRQARAEFEALLAEYPELESASEGLDELRKRRFSITPMAFGVGHVYAGHPTLSWAAGASVSLPMVIARHFLLTSTYRYTRYLPVSSDRGQGMMTGPGGNDTELDPFDQHMVHVGAGLTWPRVGMLAQYAYLDDGSPLRNHAQVIGLSVRYSPWGDGILDGSAAAFASGWIGRVAPSWRMPASSWLDVRPGFALQFVGRELLPSGFASLIFHGRVGALVLGGKGGLEERPVYLETPAIFAFDGRILWGAWIAGDLRLGRGVHLHASYETHHLRAPTDSGGIAPTQMHYIALGLSWRSAEAASP